MRMPDLAWRSWKREMAGHQAPDRGWFPLFSDPRQNQISYQ